VEGRAPSFASRRGRATLSFLDLFPVAWGTLVVTKHFDPSRLGRRCGVGAASRRVAHAIREAIAPDGLGVFQLNGAAAGQTVFHYHMHLVPRWHGQEFKLHSRVRGNEAALAAVRASGQRWSVRRGEARSDALATRRGSRPRAIRNCGRRSQRRANRLGESRRPAGITRTPGRQHEHGDADGTTRASADRDAAPCDRYLGRFDHAVLRRRDPATAIAPSPQPAGNSENSCPTLRARSQHAPFEVRQIGPDGAAPRSRRHASGPATCCPPWRPSTGCS
jgi:histidine triad (HIT) family protein